MRKNGQNVCINAFRSSKYSRLLLQMEQNTAEMVQTLCKYSCNVNCQKTNNVTNENNLETAEIVWTTKMKQTVIKQQMYKTAVYTHVNGDVHIENSKNHKKVTLPTITLTFRQCDGG